MLYEAELWGLKQAVTQALKDPKLFSEKIILSVEAGMPVATAWEGGGWPSLWVRWRVQFLNLNNEKVVLAPLRGGAQKGIHCYVYPSSTPLVRNVINFSLPF